MGNPKLIVQSINGVRSSQERSLVDVSADEDMDISIFDAQRYFDETNGDARVCKRNSPMKDPISPELRCDISASALAGRFSSASSVADGYGYGRSHRARSFHATPTASPEASWNSQTGLLSNPPGAIPVSMIMKTPTTTDHKTKGSSKMKWLWGRRCPCSGKKSVQVEPKTPLGSNQKRNIIHHDQKREEILLACNPYRISVENQFRSSLGQRVIATATARPLMISDGGSAVTTAGFTFPILNQHNRNHNSLDDHNYPPRHSLELFRPSDESPSISNPKKLVPRTSIADDDVGSDTSSDLFEIESFSTSNPLYHRRDSLDEASNFNIRRSIGGSGNGSGTYSPMTTECYEPSEASIEWSVTTAEGLERGSVEAEEMMNMNMRGSATGVSNGGKKKSGNGGLLSCRCEKAVSVGPNPVKYVPPHGQADTSSKHVGNVNKPPLARLSLPFVP
ncbi:Detected protein of unknown function [Hibiscus syriacus]|uniref:Protein PHYTOCHROME KINASE SUBSTRATE 4 n=2 Tax=Hibiscus syriacus TaxID=106335 RepID=A0A6A2WMA1_HIBSY|nr:Detected protein of unknown function [Hibiscus syriacus]